MNSPIIVTAAIIKKNNKILIAKRKKDSKFEALKWEFPGGKVEFLETPEASLIREIKEELNLNISVDKFLMPISHVYKKGDLQVHVILLFYFCSYLSGELKLIECDDAKFIDKSELKNFEFAEADKDVVKHLLNLNSF